MEYTIYHGLTILAQAVRFGAWLIMVGLVANALTNLLDTVLWHRGGDSHE